jgi:hypothetical protein
MKGTENTTVPSSSVNLWSELSNIPDTFKTSMVTQDGKTLTNVNPHEAVRRMTKIFGTCGVGWGIEPGDVTDIGDVVLIKVKVWFRPHSLDPSRSPEETAHVAAWGGVLRVKGDVDLFKKAMTNGFSKAISYLGFASEVYLDEKKEIPDADKPTSDEHPAAAATVSPSPSPQPPSLPDPKDWQPYADVYRKTKLPDYGIRYRWRIRGTHMSFWTDKVPNGAWDIMRDAGFKVHTGPHGGRVSYLLVPLSEVRENYDTLRGAIDLAQTDDAENHVTQ